MKDGTNRKIGELLDLPDNEAQELINAGAAKKAGDKGEQQKAPR